MDGYCIENDFAEQDERSALRERPASKIPTMVYCHECNRGGRGNAKDKCACGWKQSRPSSLGCFSGTPIVGEPRKPEKVSRSKQRYLDYLEVSECFDNFRQYLKHLTLEKHYGVGDYA